ncbi:aldo/keto reductase [Rugosimonospora acidiphila]|uniref:Aldo/keto reductase n=1 Tax=Rugosimonospora acidiphila TaxID=556531 RepID=A0ABP9RTX5_9ACTN
MEFRKIGGLGLTSSALGLGCMGMTGAYGTADETESVNTIHRAIDLGVTMFDTADVYGPFIGEQLLGRALAGRRDDVLIATKFGGAAMDDSGRVIGGVNGRPEYVRASVERSLRNLNTDRIDLYYQHRVDPDVPVEETFGALGELVTAGKLRYLGISEADAATIRRAHAAAPLSAVETEYSLFSRDVERSGVLATVRELGVGFVAYAPLGRGFLTGTVRSNDMLEPTDLRRSFPRFENAALAQNLAVLERITQVAAQLNVTTGQIALAWVLNQGTHIIAIPGTRRRTHLTENVAAAALHLNAETLSALAEAIPTDAVAGARRSPLDSAIQE